MKNTHFLLQKEKEKPWWYPTCKYNHNPCMGHFRKSTSICNSTVLLYPQQLFISKWKTFIPFQFEHWLRYGNSIWTPHSSTWPHSPCITSYHEEIDFIFRHNPCDVTFNTSLMPPVACHHVSAWVSSLIDKYLWVTRQRKNFFLAC